MHKLMRSTEFTLLKTCRGEGTIKRRPFLIVVMVTGIYTYEKTAQSWPRKHMQVSACESSAIWSSSADCTEVSVLILHYRHTGRYRGVKPGEEIQE